MSPEKLKEVRKIYDETLREIGVKKLQEIHWYDEELLKTIGEPNNDTSVESLYHKLGCLELIMRGGGSDVTTVII